MRFLRRWPKLAIRELGLHIFLQVELSRSAFRILVISFIVYYEEFIYFKIMYYPEIKQKAIKLRKAGYSYNYIVKHVPVAKSTLSEWLHDIPFTPNEYTLRTIGSAHVASGNYKHKIMIESLRRAEIQAQKDIGILSKRDIIMLGLGIYIGEGGKTVNITKITNSDYKIIKFAIKWFKTSFGVDMKQFKIRLHLYRDNDEKRSIEYWSKNTGIPKNQFFKSSFDRRTNKKLSNNRKLPFGTSHMTVQSLGNKDLGSYLHRRIMAWINIVLC